MKLEKVAKKLTNKKIRNEPSELINSAEMNDSD